MKFEPQTFLTQSARGGSACSLALDGRDFFGFGLFGSLAKLLRP